MNKMVLAGLVILCSLVIVVSFFMPWAKASVNPTKAAKGLVTSASNELKDTPFAGKFIKSFDKATVAVSELGDIEVKTQVSGYDIPTLVNKKSSRIALSLAQMLFKDAKDLDKKSKLVFLLPIFALVCIGLAVLSLQNKMAIIAMGVISGAISIGGLYNLFTTDLKSLPIEVVIGSGLWQTMYSYLVIFIASIAWFVIDKKKA